MNKSSFEKYCCWSNVH